jgi:hypothetical protein
VANLNASDFEINVHTTIPDSPMPHRFPFYHLNVLTGELRMIRGDRCDNTDKLVISDPFKLWALKTTDPTAFNDELDRIYDTHRHSGLFAHLFPAHVRICMFCRSRKGRKVEALANCKCFALKSVRVNEPMHIVVYNRLKSTMDESANVYSRLSMHTPDHVKGLMLSYAAEVGYVMRFNSVSKNYDQLKHDILNIDCMQTRNVDVVGIYYSIIMEIAIHRIQRRKYFSRVIANRLMNAKVLK